MASAISNRELSSSRLSSGGEPLRASFGLALSTLEPRQERLLAILTGEVQFHRVAKFESRALLSLFIQSSHFFLEENHRGLYGGYFSGYKLYSTLVKRWWQRGM